MRGLRFSGVPAGAFFMSVACAGSAWAQTGATEGAKTGLVPVVAPHAAPAAFATQMDILTGLAWLMVLLIVVGALLILNLQNGARKLAETSDAARDRYYTLPFGVPEGTVRGLLSILVIVLGIAVLIVQEPLGIESSEAVAGFVSAVIAFYFVTREQAQTRGAIEQSSRALEEGASALRQANETLEIVSGKPMTARKSVFMSKAAVGVSHMEIDNLVYVEVADALENDPTKFDPARAIGKGGDGLTGYNFQAKWLRPIVSEIIARARIKAPLAPHESVISITGDDAAKLAEAALKGDAAALIGAIGKKIEKCLTDASVPVTLP